jgi:hypothetical protein
MPPLPLWFSMFLLHGLLHLSCLGRGIVLGVVNTVADSAVEQVGVHKAYT